MTPAFWDASALVPLCVPGEGATRSRQLIRQYKPVVWWGTFIEIWSAVARLARQGHIDSGRQEAASRRLSLLRESWREVQPTSRLRELAELQLDRYELRAADALQLAAALVWCSGRPKGRHFLCRDRRLTDAARQAGFTVIP